MSRDFGKAGTITTTVRDPAQRRPRLAEVAVLLAFVWGETIVFLLPPLPRPGYFWEGAISQSFFALALLDVALSKRPWRSIGLSGENLLSSLALGALYCLIVVALNLVAIWLGFVTHGTMIGGEPSRVLGVPLALTLYLLCWGIFESTWMLYLIYTINRWLTGGYALRWRALLLAALWFGSMHAFTQVVAFGTPPPQAVASILVGLALLVPGTIPKFTGNAWGLILWWVVTNFGL